MKVNKFKTNQQLAKAFKIDCTNLLESFNKIENGKFEDFAKLYFENQFDLLTMLHKTLIKYQAFNYSAIKFVKRLLLSEDVNHPQIGVLYLLYMIYHTQKNLCNNHIEMNLKEFNLFVQIIESLCNQGHKEAMYIFNYFDQEDAFYYIVANENTRNTIGNEKKEIKEENNVFLKESLIDQLEKQVGDYKESFSEYVSQKTEEIPEPYCDKLKSSVENVDTIFNELSSFLPTINSISSDTLPKDQNGEPVNSRILLKMKAMQNKVSDPKHTISVHSKVITKTEIVQEPVEEKKRKITKYRSRKGLLQMVNDDSSEEEDSVSKKIKKEY